MWTNTSAVKQCVLLARDLRPAAKVTYCWKPVCSVGMGETPFSLFIVLLLLEPLQNCFFFKGGIPTWCCFKRQSHLFLYSPLQSPLPFLITFLVLSFPPFRSPFLPFPVSHSPMLNENQAFSRPNQDVLGWMSLIMGWVNSEFQDCWGINGAQWEPVGINYCLLTSEEEEQICSGLKGFDKNQGMSKQWLSKQLPNV